LFANHRGNVSDRKVRHYVTKNPGLMGRFDHKCPPGKRDNEKTEPSLKKTDQWNRFAIARQAVFQIAVFPK